MKEITFIKGFGRMDKNPAERVGVAFQTKGIEYTTVHCGAGENTKHVYTSPTVLAEDRAL